MNQEIKISENKRKFFLFLLASLFAAGVGVLGISNGELFGWIAVTFFGLGVIVFSYKLIKTANWIKFTTSEIVINIANQEKIVVPWIEIDRIGLQTMGIPMVDKNQNPNLFGTAADVTNIETGNLGGVLNPADVADFNYLVLSFKDPTQYHFNLGRTDRLMFYSKNDFESCMGDFKGDLYIDLLQNTTQKQAEQLPDEFEKKLGKKLEKLPYLLRTDDAELYRKAVNNKLSTAGLF